MRAPLPRRPQATASLPRGPAAAVGQRPWASPAGAAGEAPWPGPSRAARPFWGSAPGGLPSRRRRPCRLRGGRLRRFLRHLSLRLDNFLRDTLLGREVLQDLLALGGVLALRPELERAAERRQRLRRPVEPVQDYAAVEVHDPVRLVDLDGLVEALERLVVLLHLVEREAHVRPGLVVRNVELDRLVVGRDRPLEVADAPERKPLVEPRLV